MLDVWIIIISICILIYKAFRMALETSDVPQARAQNYNRWNLERQQEVEWDLKYLTNERQEKYRKILGFNITKNMVDTEEKITAMTARIGMREGWLYATQEDRQNDPLWLKAIGDKGWHAAYTLQIFHQQIDLAEMTRDPVGYRNARRLPPLIDEDDNIFTDSQELKEYEWSGKNTYEMSAENNRLYWRDEARTRTLGFGSVTIGDKTYRPLTPMEEIQKTKTTAYYEVIAISEDDEEVKIRWYSTRWAFSRLEQIEDYKQKIKELEQKLESQFMGLNSEINQRIRECQEGIERIKAAQAIPQDVIDPRKRPRVVKIKNLSQLKDLGIPTKPNYVEGKVLLEDW